MQEACERQTRMSPVLESVSGVPLAQTRPNSLPLLSLALTDSLARWLARWARDSGRWTKSPEQKGGDAAGCGLGVWAREPPFAAEWR